MLKIRHLHTQRNRRAWLSCLSMALFVLMISTTQAQNRHCSFDESQRAEIPQPTAEELEAYRLLFPPCNSPTATKNVRVNVHFMLDDAGGNNFLPHEDGYGNRNYTGYTFAEEMIEKANVIWARQDDGTVGPNLYNGTGNPNLPMRVRLLLTGVYFHKNSYWSYYTEGNSSSPAAWAVNTTYGVNTWNTINIYIASNPNNGGIACGIGGICANSNGLATKLIDCWHVYRRDPNWASAYSADLLNHELGHIFGLIHDFQGTNTYPSWGDACEDTPDHNECWTMNPNDPLCNSWSLVSNNMMAYSDPPAALTPCQINRIHSSLNGIQQNYVHSCADCLPANAFYTIDPQFCARAKIGGGYFPVDVMLDGRGSFNEDSYLIEIFEVDTMGSNVIVSNHFMQQYSGQLGQINLRTFCNYNFQIGKTYRVRVIASKTNCLPTSEQTQWISVVACTPETSTPTPTVPIKKSLTIIARQPKNYILHSELAQQAQVFIYDFTGRLLYQLPKMSLQTGENSLELSSLDLLLSNNFYILAVQTAEGVETHRFNIP